MCTWCGRTSIARAWPMSPSSARNSPRSKKISLQGNQKASMTAKDGSPFPAWSTPIAEIPELIERHGVASFKIFMFYGSHGLHGRSDAQREFLMIGPEERYDYAHFEFIMRAVQAARERFADKAQQISLSLHCETAEIMTAYTKIAESQKNLEGLAAYHAARPPHSEGLAVFVAAYLANETALPAINLLHLSS